MDSIYREVRGYCEMLGMQAISPLLVLAGMILVLFLLWFLIRRIKLWYWKTDEQLAALRQIDDRLREMEEIILTRSENSILKAGENDFELLFEDREEAQCEASEEQRDSEGIGDHADSVEVIREEPQKAGSAHRTERASGWRAPLDFVTAVGKSGRVYTEAELEEQIKE